MVVVPGRDKVVTQPLSQGAGARHRVASEILVVTGVLRGNQVLGEDARDQLKTLREPMLHQLINWLPEGADLEMYWQGGQLLSLVSNTILPEAFAEAGHKGSTVGLCCMLGFLCVTTVTVIVQDANAA